MTLSQIEDKINELAEVVKSVGGSRYFFVENENGENVQIRVSDHSANRTNNSDSFKTLSFVTERTSQKKSAYNAMVNEWVLIGGGLVDTYQELSYIIREEI